MSWDWDKLKEDIKTGKDLEWKWYKEPEVLIAIFGIFTHLGDFVIKLSLVIVFFMCAFKYLTG